MDNRESEENCVRICDHGLKINRGERALERHYEMTKKKSNCPSCKKKTKKLEKTFFWTNIGNRLVDCKNEKSFAPAYSENMGFDSEESDHSEGYIGHIDLKGYF